MYKYIIINNNNILLSIRKFLCLISASCGLATHRFRHVALTALQRHVALTALQRQEVFANLVRKGVREGVRRGVRRDVI